MAMEISQKRLETLEQLENKNRTEYHRTKR
jgi:hypothetical protein